MININIKNGNMYFKDFKYIFIGTLDNNIYIKSNINNIIKNIKLLENITINVNSKIHIILQNGFIL